MIASAICWRCGCLDGVGDGWGAGAVGWWGQLAMATRGRDFLLNVPFPREQPDLLMAESPPTGGLSALNPGHAVLAAPPAGGGAVLSG